MNTMPLVVCISIWPNIAVPLPTLPWIHATPHMFKIWSAEPPKCIYPADLELMCQNMLELHLHMHARTLELSSLFHTDCLH